MTTDVDSPANRPRQRPAARQCPPAGGYPPPRRGPRPAGARPAPPFRFPAADDPDPGTVRVLTMSLYAAALGLAGVGLGLRALVSVIGGVPGWYVPVLVLAGLVSVALAVGAFLSLHRPALPWALLLTAAVPLAGAITIAVTY